MSVKEIAMNVMASLPDDVSWDELQYRLYVREVVEESDKEFEAGLGILHEEAKQRLKKWLDSIVLRRMMTLSESSV